MHINELKTFNAERLDIHDLIALAAFGRALRNEYEQHQIEEPDWLDTQLKAVRREIHSRNADSLESRRKEIDLRLDSLKTPAEKRAELLKEKQKIDRKLEAVGA